MLLQSLQVFGNLVEAVVSLFLDHEKITKALDKSKGTIRIKTYFSQEALIVTCDPENVHYIMTSNFSRYHKGPEWRKRLDIFGDHGVFNSDFEEWKSQIKTIRDFLSHKKFHQLTEKTIPGIIKNQLVPVLEHISKQNAAVDLQDLFKRYTFDFASIISTGFNPKTLCIEFPEIPFSNAMDDACEAIFYRHIMPESWWKLQRWLGIGKERKYSNSIKTVDEFAMKQISIRRAILSKSMKIMEVEEEESFNLLNLYFSGHEISGAALTDEKIIKDNLIGFIFATEDTSRTALSWFFWLISQNPSVEMKIREELRRNLPQEEDKEGRVFWHLDELNRLVYLHAALCESLRLFPPAPFEIRTPMHEDSLPSGQNVNPNTPVIVCSYAMGRMAWIWGDDCEEFKPERWITEDGGIKHYPQHKFLAFNARPRVCLGKTVAFALMKAVAATVIHNFEVQVLKNHRMKPKLSISLGMKNGLFAKVKSRLK
ncbi:alkane hydroxylase MAH1-like [Mangifera indica]|uniref:alkane hydroxylase MAH1-like n=1 Tax=Mangifera indica TaxID=29780 RepID=UPI001CFB8BC2|nr:alkane hydroxylase MAH1-like [Mangifera indica]